jgi:2-polyprenyl-6-methoxyphenol hydroxylase-like FAD-dependent oxidoreductase
VIHVVGAGIAGLASALALRAAGLPVRVVERAATPRARGGGIGLTPNGMHALHRLGVGDAVCARSVVQSEGGVRTPSGRWLARSDLAFVHRRYGEHVRAMLRRDLVAVLTAALPPGTVHYGHTAALVAPGSADGPARLRVGADVVPSELVVVADGIRSAIRRALFPAHPGLRDCGSASWRAVVPASGLTLVPAETWGAGLRLSILPLPAGHTHFSALATDAARAGATLDALFGRWHDPVPALLARAAEAEVHLDRIEELAAPLPALHRGRVVLVGDAAHPMAPNVGLANVALEDAVELAHRVDHTVDTADFAALRAALADYDRVRRPRVDRLARISRWTGRVVESAGPVAVAARNAGTWLGGLLPEAVSRRSLDTLVGWSPPTPVRPG